MGLRSTFITIDANINFSQEFIDKYSDAYNFMDGCRLPISTKYERPRFSDSIEKDIVAELRRMNDPIEINAVWLHEDGSINRIIINKLGVEEIEMKL